MSRPAKLPALSPVNTGNPALDTLLRQMIERMDVREGSRGDPMEKVVTHREMKALGLDSDQIGAAGLSRGVVGGSRGGVMVQTPGGSFTRVPYDVFADELRKTALYRDLMQSINSVNRFDGVPQEVRAILLSSLADEAAQWGAEIRRLDKKIQSETESLAYTVETITAAVSGAAAGVREVSFASATANAATAGKITQVTARLNDFSDGTPGTATIEQKMTATASKTTGLGAQYTLKVGTGGKYAGIGLASETSTAGVSTSAIIFSTDKFALVGPNEIIADPANPPVNRLPFGYDSATNTLFINGQVRINAGGTALQDAVGVPGPAGTPGSRGSVTRYTTGAWNGADNSYISLFPGSSLVLGDTLTSSNGVTRYWDGTSSWVNPGVIIDGNLLVSGTVAASKISAGTITAAVSLSTSGFVKANGQTASAFFSGYTASGVFNDSRGQTLGLVGVSHASSAGAGVIGYGSGAGFGVWAYGYGSGGALQVSGNSNLAGELTISGRITSSSVAGGAPISVASTTLCTNLNADLLDGLHATDFYRSTNPNGYITAASLSGYAGVGHGHTNYTAAYGTNSGTAYPSSNVMVFSCTVPGFRFRADGNMVIFEQF
jgi:hypothetical protein